MNKPRSDSVGLAVAGSKLDTSDEDRKEMLKILIQDAIKDAEAPVEESEQKNRLEIHVAVIVSRSFFRDGDVAQTIKVLKLSNFPRPDKTVSTF